ncbi:MAG: response regulator [Spirochaetes bacterium]|nr:response regulator [Spirochaetota bacterium]
MAVLLYEPINQVQVLMVNALIQNGVMVFATANKFDILARLHTKQFPVLICDGSADETELITILQDIKKDEELAGTRIILHTRTPSREFLMDMVKLGVAGFILKPFQAEPFIAKFNEIMAKFATGPMERKNIRIKPDPKDNATVTVRSSATFKLVSGRILDISMGGLLLQSVTPLGEAELAPKQLIKNVQIKFRLVTIELSAVVIAKKDNTVALKFFQVPDFEKNTLSKYIYENMVVEFNAKK